MNRSLLLALLIVAQTAAGSTRNPFQPLVTPCDALFSRLEQWKLHGVISSEKGQVALMQDPQKAWRRIAVGQLAEPSAEVVDISQKIVSARLPAECRPSVYSWEIKGKQHGMDARDSSAGGVAAGMRRK